MSVLLPNTCHERKLLDLLISISFLPHPRHIKAIPSQYTQSIEPSLFSMSTWRPHPTHLTALELLVKEQCVVENLGLSCVWCTACVDFTVMFYLQLIFPPSGASEREPTVLGKPSSFMLDHIVKATGIASHDKILIVGDRLDTDIQWGLENGAATLLVLTGKQMAVAGTRHTPCINAILTLLRCSVTPNTIPHSPGLRCIFWRTMLKLG